MELVDKMIRAGDLWIFCIRRNPVLATLEGDLPEKLQECDNDRWSCEDAYIWDLCEGFTEKYVAPISGILFIAPSYSCQCNVLHCWHPVRMFHSFVRLCSMLCPGALGQKPQAILKVWAILSRRILLLTFCFDVTF